MLTSSLSAAAGGGTATNNTITATGATSGGHNRLTTIQDRIQMMKKRLANLNESLDNVTGGDSANTSSYISGIGGGGGGERRQSHHSRHGRAASDTMGLQHAGAREKESVGRIAADSVHNLHHREHEDGSWTEKQQQQPSRHQHDEQHWQHQQQQQQRRGTAEPTPRVPSSSPDLYRSSSSYLNNDHRHEGGEDRQQYHQYHEPYRHHHQQYNMSGASERKENLPTTEEDSYLDRSVSSTTVGGALSNAPSYLGGRNIGNNNAAARRSPSAHNNTNHNAGDHINVNSSEYQYNLRQASMSMGGGAGGSGRVASGYMYDGYNSNHHHSNTNRGGGGGVKNTADAFYRAPSADRMREGVGGGGVSTVVSRMTSVSVPRPNNAIWATEEGGPSFPSSSSTQSAGFGDRGNGTTVVLPQPTPLLHTNSMRSTAPRLSQRSERNRGTIDNGEEEEEEEESSSNQALLIATLLKQQDEMRRAMEEQAAALKALTSSSSSAVRSSPQKQKGRALYQEERDGSTAEDFISDDGRRGAEPSRSPSPPLASRERLIKSANHKDFSPSFVPQGASDEDESKEGPGNPSSKAPVKGDSREHQGMSLEEMQQTLRERLASSQQQRHLRQRGQPKSEATYDDNDDDDQEEVNYDDDEEEKKDSVSGSYGGKAVKGSEERGGGNSDRALGSSKASAMASIKQQKSAGTSSFPTSSFALPSKSAKRSASPSANSNSHPAEEQHNGPRGGGGQKTPDVERTQRKGQLSGKGVEDGKRGIADSKDTPHLMTAMTGAEVFAVLRLRGLIASRGDTGERLLPQSRCHSMALSENELSQLEELRESLAMMMMMASTSSSNNTNNSNPTTAVIPPSRSYSQANATQQSNENRSTGSSTGGRPAVRDGAGTEMNFFVGSAPLNARRSATLHQLESSRSASNQSRRSHSPNLSERSNALRGPATIISGTSAPLPRRPPSPSVRSMSSASQSMNAQHQTPAHFGAQSMHKNTKDDSGMRMAPTPTPIVAGNSLYATNNMQKRNSGGSTRESVHM